MTEAFERDGLAIAEGVLSSDEVDSLARDVATLPAGLAGTRTVLQTDWGRALARRLRTAPALAPLMPADAVAVQATYFAKTAGRNWMVAWHRDQVVPVRLPASGAPGWRNPTRKEGVPFAEPPAAVLDGLVAVRVHLERNTVDNGPLQVVPGSHQTWLATGERGLPEATDIASGPAGEGRKAVACLVGAGGVVVMRPLVLHASARMSAGTRRVVHFLFGPRTLPDGAAWWEAV